MCVLFLSYQPIDPRSPYILIAANNRDEFFARRTAPAAFWDDHPTILGGRDLHRQNGGTWLGISKNGRFGVLTNYRTRVEEVRPDARSRGPLITEFLLSESPPLEFSQDVLKQGCEFNGFSLLTASLSGPPSSRHLVYCTNREGRGVEVLGPGVYGLSNQVLDSPWRKVEVGKERFSQILVGIQPSTSKKELADQLMELLCDTTCHYPDPNVPETGFSEEVMKVRNSIFVSPLHQYGTRTSSVVLVDQQGEVVFTERTMAEPISDSTPQWETRTFTFNISH